jgi:hypothetical protein
MIYKRCAIIISLHLHPFTYTLTRYYYIRFFILFFFHFLLWKQRSAFESFFPTLFLSLLETSWLTVPLSRLFLCLAIHLSLSLSPSPAPIHNPIQSLLLPLSKIRPCNPEFKHWNPILKKPSKPSKPSPITIIQFPSELAVVAHIKEHKKAALSKFEIWNNGNY